MPYIVPGPTPAPRTGFGDFAQGVGGSLEKIQDLLLQAILSGQLVRSPSAGQFSAPSGASTFISPAERVASNPNMSAASLISRQPTGSMIPTQYHGFESVPNISRLLQQLQVQKAKLDIAAAPEDLRKSKAQADLTEKAARGEIQFYVDPATGQAMPMLPTTRGNVPVQPSQVPLISVNPMTGEATQSGTVARNAKVVSSPAVTPEKAQALSALDSMIASIDAMESALQVDPNHLIKSRIPFMDRDFRAITDQFDKEAAIAAGGKQLTQTELNLIRSTRPTVQDVKSPEAIQRKIAKLRAIAANAKSRLETGKSTSSTQLSPTAQSLIDRYKGK